MTGVKGLGTVTGGVGGFSTLTFSKYEGPTSAPSLPTSIKELADIGGGSGIFEPSWEPYTGPTFEEIPSIAAAQVGAALSPGVTPIEQAKAPSAAPVGAAVPQAPPEPLQTVIKLAGEAGPYSGLSRRPNLPSVPSNIEELTKKAISYDYPASSVSELKALSSPLVPTVATKQPEMKLRIMAVDTKTLKGYPESPSDLSAAAKAALRKYYPEGEANGVNEKISKLAPSYAPLVITKAVDANSLARFLDDLERIKNGSGYQVDVQLNLKEPGILASKSLGAFTDLPVEQQKYVLAAIAKDGINQGMPPGIVADALNTFVSSVTGNTKKQLLEHYVRNGDLDKMLKSTDTVWAAEQSAKSWFGSGEGQLTVGAVAGVLGTVGGFITAGPGGALVGAGMSVFATTEIANYFGMDPFRNKSILQAAGLWPDDHVIAYSTAEKTLRDELESFRFDAKKMSTDDAKARLNELRQHVEDLGNTLGNEWPFLVAANQYDTKLKQYQSIRSYFDEIAATALSSTPSSGFASDTPATVTVSNIPSGWKVELGTIKFGSGKYVQASTSEAISGPLKITTSDGKVYYGPEYKIYPGGAPLVIGNVEDIVNRQKVYEKTPETTPEGKVTIYVPPGYTATYLNQKLEGGTSGQRYDITGTPGTQLSILFEAPGKTPDVLNSMIPLGGGWKEETKYLEDTFKRTETPKMGIAALNFEPTQEVYIDGVKIDPSKYGLGVYLQSGYHNITVIEPGYKEATKSVYVAPGTTTSLALKGYPDTTKSTTPSYGGGGGRGGGGGYTAPAKVSYGIIVFGPTCEGAAVLLDGSPLYPEIGKQYSISPGYHAIELTKPGYEAWIKTVYVAEGDTLTVSPVFTALPTSTPTSTGSTATTSTKRVYFNTNPGGAKVLVDNEWTGYWTPSYSDVALGYHIVSFYKSGYNIPSIPLWVGDTILWGEAATAAAQAAGVI